MNILNVFKDSAVQSFAEALSRPIAESLAKRIILVFLLLMSGGKVNWLLAHIVPTKEREIPILEFTYDDHAKLPELSINDIYMRDKITYDNVKCFAFFSYEEMEYVKKSEAGCPELSERWDVMAHPQMHMGLENGFCDQSTLEKSPDIASGSLEKVLRCPVKVIAPREPNNGQVIKSQTFGYWLLVPYEQESLSLLKDHWNKEILHMSASLIVHQVQESARIQLE